MFGLIYKSLRSRRLAIGLIGGLVGYAAIVTIGPRLVEHPFANPLFLGAGTLLCAATIACAVERTKAASSISSSLASREAIEARLRDHPPSAIRVASDITDPLREASEVLRRMGLAGVSSNGVLLASSRRWAAFASPVFHWALAALLAAIIVGQLVRVEGGINAVVGSPVLDEQASYLPGANRGLLFPGHSGQQLLAVETTRAVIVAGVERGQGALVTLSRSDQVVKSQWVYPNHVLRSGSIMVFVANTGPAAYLEITIGGTTKRVPVAFDTPGSTDGLLGAETLQVSKPDGTELTVTVEPLLGQRVRVTVAGQPSEDLAAGAVTSLPDGGSIKLAELTSFALLTIVRDPSVPFVYALFVVALLGLSAALFLPPRSCAVMIVRERDGGSTLRVLTRATRVDMAFRGRVNRALETAVGQHTEGA